MMGNASVFYAPFTAMFARNLHFLLVRRKKIRNLVGDIRGGAAQVPGKVLDALLEPKKAMGIKCDGDDPGPAPHGGAGANSSRTLWDYAKMALDF